MFHKDAFMYIFEKIKKQIARQINEALGNKFIQAPDLVCPPNIVKASPGKSMQDLGDLSLPCFNVARKLSKTPIEVAANLVRKVKAENAIAGLKAVGPYLNFTLNKEELAQDALRQISKMKDEYGKNKSGREKRVMIEYSNANTHKEYHVGHLRNICYGDAVNRILGANGYKNIPVSYINDFGIHIAKTLWAYLNFYKDKKVPENKGYFLGQVYVRATKGLEKDEKNKEMVNFLMKKIETKKGNEYKLWQETRQWSIDQFSKIYEELDIKFDHIFYESEFIDKGLKMVKELESKKILEKSEGAVIANLGKYNLGVLMFLRSDCTALYPVADIPLAIEKIKKYKLDKSIYVVDVRQGLYFKQLFKILELCAIGTKCPVGHLVPKQGFKLPEMAHLGHEFVKLPSGMMSSRSGNVITYEELRDQVLAKAKEETKKRHEDWDDVKINKVAGVITIGAIKFEMVKVGADQVITFDINQALRFDGFTAAYLQYTYARINSILKKSKVKSQKLKANYKNLTEKKEHELVMQLAKYPEIVLKAGEKYDPSEVAKYLFELARSFNDYYHSMPVLKAKEEIRIVRLVLISAVKQMIANGLDLLGIKVIDEM